MPLLRDCSDAFGAPGAVVRHLGAVAADGDASARDPIEEQGGLNLYAFARNHPIVLSERLGLISFVDVALPVLEGALYAGEFCAGAANSFTFGATKYLRDLINEALTGTGDYGKSRDRFNFSNTHCT